ncbi:hypothetical protein BD769DRAFT_1680262 [Suillus cothurnatus]|jgi:hypothetical protein|nr:hypothetical protein BD769DRAFT_1680262 [Suillus cothurnatus]
MPNQTKPNQPIDGAPPRVVKVRRMMAAPRQGAANRALIRRKMVPHDSPVALQSKTPMETSKEREKRERDEAIMRASLRDKAILKAWNERIRMAKRPRDNNQVKITEPTAKKACTGKERIMDEDDKVVIVEAPTRDEKEEEEERCLRNREERRLRLLKAGIRV